MFDKVIGYLCVGIFISGGITFVTARDGGALIWVFLSVALGFILSYVIMWRSSL